MDAQSAAKLLRDAASNLQMLADGEVQLNALDIMVLHRQASKLCELAEQLEDEEEQE